MRFINDSALLVKEFRRLLHAYDNYCWMVAWAGDPFLLTELLESNVDKLKQIVVGLHFYQTHPDFIEKFINNENVRFIHETSGTFHPKVYLFYNSPESWEAIVGSANFTKAAFSSNNEAVMLFKAEDTGPETFNQLTGAINRSWQNGRRFTGDELADYRRYWTTQKRNRESLGTFHIQNTDVPIFQIPFVRMNWREFVGRIYHENGTSVEERIRVLDLAQEYFGQYPTFSDMPEEMRASIGGYRWSGLPADFRLFGTMLNATTFTHQIKKDPSGISEALDFIPLAGEVTRDQYFQFVNAFNASVNGGNKYRSATRLLAMKRPDLFFCISTGNDRQLAQDFRIGGISTMNLTRYWDEVVIRMKESNWWQHPEPENETERKIALYRAAFMDALYYT